MSGEGVHHQAPEADPGCASGWGDMASSNAADWDDSWGGNYRILKKNFSVRNIHSYCMEVTQDIC